MSERPARGTTLTAVIGNSLGDTVEAARAAIARIEASRGEIVDIRYTEVATERQWHYTVLLIYRAFDGLEEPPVIASASRLGSIE